MERRIRRVFGDYFVYSDGSCIHGFVVCDDVRNLLLSSSVFAALNFSTLRGDIKVQKVANLGRYVEALRSDVTL